MTLTIMRGGLADIAEADAIIREAAGWLIRAGMELWGPEEISFEALRRVAEERELVMGRVSGEAAACMYLHKEDTLFWPEARAGEAFYIHRLAVARKFKGLGFAKEMLVFAAAEARAAGRAHLRLDCEPREKLLALYRGAGFQRIDPEPIQVGRHFVVRHEMRV
jgi:ribosomal protein S18 acetylase RimI-like enzyme